MIYAVLAITLFILVVIGFVTMVYHAIFYAPFVPTPHRVAEKMIKAAKIKKGEKVYDLGAGDGRLTILAEKEGAAAKGFEISWFPYLVGKINILLRKSEAKILKRNFLHEKLDEANCIFCYLWPNLMVKLQKKFEKELKRGTKIIS
jgi:16S rRNA A1518/A1519 N6-dimethyltransferase RsmA/KsgA/DIM1 with predicted DNA glycosylase/AP lyase activity